MKRVFKTRYFKRWMRKTELTNAALCVAVVEMTNGLVDAELGGGIVKKRIGISDRGKRSGVRTLIATQKGGHWFFVYGFEKNERSNISSDELEALQAIAGELFALTDQELSQAVENTPLEEICHDPKN